MTGIRHFDDPGSLRFVTFTCFRHYQYLSDPASRSIVLSSIDHLRTRRQIQILAWVLMPEHVHLVLYPPLAARLGVEIGRLKSWTAHEIVKVREGRLPVLKRPNGGNVVWERRCFDHNLRSIQGARKVADYCHLNPVRRGLVTDASQWPWSSYRWYTGKGKVLLEIDGLEWGE